MMAPNTPPTVFLSGASGFVGSAVLAALRRAGHRVRALVHRRRPAGADDPDVIVTEGSILDGGDLDRAMTGAAAVIHLVGIIAEKPSQGITFRKIHVEGTEKVLEAAKRVGIRRHIQMSAAGARVDAPAEYHRTKFAAEEAVRASGMDWTIFRPSLIHGAGGEFMKMELAWARGKAMPFVAMPYFGRGLLGRGGAGLLQPLWVDDVARAFVEALGNTASIGQIYELGGAERISWPQMHGMVAREVVGKRRATLPIPAWYAKGLASVLPAGWLPFGKDQVIMSQEDNITDLAPFQRDFGWTPTGFGEAIARYL